MKEITTIQEIVNEYPFLDGDTDFGISSSDTGEQVIIIENSGIQKLIDNLHIRIQIESADIKPYNYNRKSMVKVGFVASVVVSGQAYRKRRFWTASSCHHNNSDFNYELELAEVRAISKLVRKIAGLYGKRAIISRDEIYEKNKATQMSAKDLKAEVTRETFMDREKAKELILARMNATERAIQDKMDNPTD